MPRTSIERFRSALEQGRKELRKGNFQLALVTFRKALRIAGRRENRRMVHQATANISSAYLQMGRPRKAEKGLREIILQSEDDRTIALACYNLASSLRRQGQIQKARFYLHRARQKCEGLLDPSASALIHNLHGNLYLDENRHGLASREYQKALRLARRSKPAKPFLVGIIEENLGYCNILQGKYRQGLAHLRHASRLAHRSGDERCQAECFQDLAFAYLLQDDCGRAEPPARAALRLAEVNDYRDILKNSLYLLGEIHYRLGNEEQSDQYIDRLQRFYPELPFLRKFLRGFDVSSLITLKNPRSDRSSV